MQKASTIIKFRHTTGLLMGLVVAMVILLSQSFYYEYLAQAQESVKIEQPADDTDSGEDDILTISQDAVSSVAQVIISFALHVISDLYVECADKIEVVVDQKVDYNSYFKTLFRLIISPNAP